MGHPVAPSSPVVRYLGSWALATELSNTVRILGHLAIWRQERSLLSADLISSCLISFGSVLGNGLPRSPRFRFILIVAIDPSPGEDKSDRRPTPPELSRPHRHRHHRLLPLAHTHSPPLSLSSSLLPSSTFLSCSPPTQRHPRLILTLWSRPPPHQPVHTSYSNLPSLLLQNHLACLSVDILPPFFLISQSCPRE